MSLRSMTVLVVAVIAFIALLDFFVAVRQKRINTHLEAEIRSLRRVIQKQTQLLQAEQRRSGMLQELLEAAEAGARFLYEDDFFTDPDMHAAADAFARYVILHRDTLRRARAGDVTGSRFLVLQPQAQSGNRILGMASAFVYALLTDRVLLVRYATDFYASLSDLFEDVGVEWEAGLPPAAAALPSAALNLAEPSYNAHVTEHLLCSNVSADLTPVLQFTSHQYFAQMLYQNPNHRPTLDALFPPRRMFNVVSALLFRPNAQVRQLVDAFYAQHLAGRPCVGLQIRSVGFNGVPMFDHELDVFRKAAESVSPPDAVWFLATDTGEAQQLLKQRWADRTLAFIPHTRSNNPAGVRQAMADLLLLGRCEALVTTSYSTYGNVAAGWANRAPLLVTDRRLDGEDRTVSYGRFQEGHRRERPRDPEAPAYMEVPQASERRLWAVQQQHAEPCHHYYGIWRPDRASCFRRSMIEEEMEHDRYC